MMAAVRSPRNAARTGKRRSARRSEIGRTLSRSRPDMREVLGHFGDALALVETVARALDAAEDDLDPTAISAGISALQQTVRALRAVYDEFDLGIARAAR